jgi:hypothetical protein
MGVAEFAASVAQYYGSYVSVAVLYIGCAVLVQMMLAMLSGKTEHDSSAA